MTFTELPDLDQGSDAWFDQRRSMVTASVVGQLITASTLKPASNDYSRGLTALLVAERITGVTEPTFVNDDMFRGIENEPRAVARYAEHFGVEVESSGFMIRTFAGCSLGYSPDGKVGKDGLLEVKSPRAKTHIRTILADEVPSHYMAQCQAGLLVSGRKWLDFISYSAGLPMWTKRVHPDERWFDAIKQAVIAFEQTATEMVAAYEKAVIGLPATERADLEIVI